MTASTASTTSRPDVAELADQVRLAAATGDPLRVVGAGHWLEAGAPVTAQNTVVTSGLTGILEYVPGDLTITARAGTTLDEIARVSAEARQWLPLDPFGPGTGTIGATIATASAGPLTTGFGMPRDMVLGLEVVTGTGAIVRAGGRVVKNVAGFDLVRLFCGSWGTLGVVTEVTLRLRALPEREETLVTVIDGSPGAVQMVRDTMRRWVFTPLAAEILDRTLAARVGLGTESVSLMRLGGNSDSIREQRRAVETIGTTTDVDPAVWARLRSVDDASAVVVRLSHLPSRIGELWAAAREIERRWPDVSCHASPARGVVRCILPGQGAETAPEANSVATALYVGVEATRVFERLPASLWPKLAPGPGPDSLEQRVKRAFDPAGVLNPGMLGLN